MFDLRNFSIPRAFAVAVLAWTIWGVVAAIAGAVCIENSPWIPDYFERPLDQRVVALSLSWRIALFVAAYSLNWICFSGRNIEGYAIALFLAGCGVILLILKPMHFIPDATPIVGDVDNTASKFVAGACLLLALLASWKSYRRNDAIGCAARAVVSNNFDPTSVRTLLAALGTDLPPDLSEDPLPLEDGTRREE